MAKDPAHIRNLKAFSRGHLTFADLPAFEAEAYGGNDRACALMMGTIAEGALLAFVSAKLRPTFSSDDLRLLFDFNAPLGTFSAKTLVPYAFNFFGPETRHDLDLIRMIRNTFAHCRKSFGFETDAVRDVCNFLKSPDWPGTFIPHGYLARVPDSQLEKASDTNHPRTRYISACHTIAERLLSNCGSMVRPLDMP